MSNCFFTVAVRLSIKPNKPTGGSNQVIHPHQALQNINLLAEAGWKKNRKNE